MEGVAGFVITHLTYVSTADRRPLTAVPCNLALAYEPRCLERLFRTLLAGRRTPLCRLALVRTLFGCVGKPGKGDPTPYPAPLLLERSKVLLLEILLKVLLEVLLLRNYAARLGCLLGFG